MGSLEDGDFAVTALLPWDLDSFDEDYCDFDEREDDYNPNLHLAQAGVTGFATVKLSRNVDYAFVVEVEWSDGRYSVVKRTYNDFCSFHYCLLEEFSHVQPRDNPMKLTFFLPAPVLEDEDSLLLAESRELELNQYVQELLKLPPKVSASATVLTFFESRSSDPKPYNESMESSNIPKPDQYVLCWI